MSRAMHDMARHMFLKDYVLRSFQFYSEYIKRASDRLDNWHTAYFRSYIVIAVLPLCENIDGIFIGLS